LEAHVALKNAFLRTDREFIADCSGTTACTVLLELCTGRLWVANVGDSRAILCRGGRALALSIDHKADLPCESERIRKAGGMNANVVFVHAMLCFVINRRVMGELAVSRAIGDRDFKENKVELIIAEPDTTEECILDSDTFLLLASDGLYDVMTNDACCEYITRALRTHGDANRAAADIVTHATQVLHSRDNVSVIILVLHRNTGTEE